MKIALHGRPITEEAAPYISSMLSHLATKGVELYINQSFKVSIGKRHLHADAQVYSSREEFPSVDLVLSIGGDGTLLETSTFVGAKSIPILGVNTGRLGFLATTARNEIVGAIDQLISGDFQVKDRSLIQVDDPNNYFNGVNFGLNEFAILKRDTSSMIVVHTHMNNEFLNSYWADGLLISTPTGSTGYSLSCGGPLVMPQAKNFIIAPVCPHNLNVRPLILPDDCELSFEVESRSNNFLISLDSRSVKVPAGTKLTVRKAPFYVKIIELRNYNYFQTLRNKLNWGLDLRN
ncbi:MAG: NAD kinase [Cytophagaceae bacterium]|jgi:NAD+ kinase|nr:NAD kinase [Cytophagaceae bacterium]